MTDTSIENAAGQLRAAYANKQPISPVRDILGNDLDIAMAYAVQDINTEHWEKQGRRIVGQKIGLTAKSVQDQLGVDAPDSGILFSDMEVGNGGVVNSSTLLQPRIEGEAAFVLGRDLDKENITRNELLRSVEYVLPAFEIVDSRIQDWDITIVDTIADNASSACYVLGAEPKKLADVDLTLCGMVIKNRGEVVSVGAGAACLGHPLNAFYWLAKFSAQNGRPLKEGDVVLTGAMGPMVSVCAGESYRLDINGLGGVSVEFSYAGDN